MKHVLIVLCSCASIASQACLAQVTLVAADRSVTTYSGTSSYSGFSEWSAGSSYTGDFDPLGTPHVDISQSSSLSSTAFDFSSSGSSFRGPSGSSRCAVTFTLSQFTQMQFSADGTGAPVGAGLATVSLSSAAVGLYGFDYNPHSGIPFVTAIGLQPGEYTLTLSYGVASAQSSGYCQGSVHIVAQLQPQSVSAIDPLNKWSWQENAGWMNWRDCGSPPGGAGVLLQSACASGFVWCENLGFLNLGDGTPANGSSYSNLAGDDAGVNILPDHHLAGLAWSENAGWFNFGPFAALPVAQQARFDPVSNRLLGYIWGENIGWVNLSDPVHFVSIRCIADFNSDVVIDLFDYLDFVDAFSSGALTADFNHDGVVDFFDYLDFVAHFAVGC